MIFLHDLIVLSVPFVREIQSLFPLPCEVDFASLTHSGESLPLVEALASGRIETTDFDQQEPWLTDDHLMLPIRLAQPLRAAVAISGVDPAFLKKMAPEWLRELQAAIQTNLETSKPLFLDPDTDLYNRRALDVLAQRLTREPYRFSYVMRVVPARLNAVRWLQKHNEISRLLFSLTEGACFSFGQGVFGILGTSQTREHALRHVHLLQRRLKREGLRQVQLAFSSLLPLAVQSSAHAGENLWKALTVAEKRGPFGLCDADAIAQGCTDPFIPIQSEAIKRGQKKWRYLECFTLVMLRAHRPVDSNHPLAPAQVKSLLGDASTFVGNYEGGLLLLLPFVEQTLVHSAVHTLTQYFAASLSAGALSMGIASWPLLDFSRDSTPANCLKALMHAELLGRGSVVYFDQLSLNVSGDHYFDGGDYRSAIREYHRGLKLVPNDVNLLNSLGVSLVACRQMARAASCFQQVLAKDPGNVMALVNLGYLNQTQGNQELALSFLEQAYQLDGQANHSGQDFLLALARLYTELGHPGQAIDVLTRWQTLPGSGNEYLLYRLLGQNYYAEGEFAKAIVACQKALQLFPHDSTAMSLLGLLYAEQGEGASLAEALCRKALEIDGYNPDHWCRLGQVLHRRGEHGAALEAARQCCTLYRHHTGSQLLRGRIFQAQGRSRRAQACFRRVINHAKTSAALKACATNMLAALAKSP